MGPNALAGDAHSRLGSFFIGLHSNKLRVLDHNELSQDLECAYRNFNSTSVQALDWTMSAEVWRSDVIFDERSTDFRLQFGLMHHQEVFLAYVQDLHNRVHPRSLHFYAIDEKCQH